MTTQQAAPPRANPTVADDVAYLAMKQQQQLAMNQLVTQAWHERMYGDVPAAPPILLTAEQTTMHARIMAANAKGQQHSDDYGVPDPPAIMLRK